MATAMPRRRSNQCEMSAISGANVAELPKPISRCTRANCQMLLVTAEAAKPTASIRAPRMTGTAMPHRSATLPISTAPAAKPIMASV